MPQITAETQGDVKDGMSFFNTFLMVFAVIALFVGAFIIFNTFSIIVAQRQKEMALLRALGASNRQVTRSVLIEATIVGLISSVAGVAAGIGVAGLLKALLSAFGFDIPAGPVVVTRARSSPAWSSAPSSRSPRRSSPPAGPAACRRSPRCGRSPSTVPPALASGWSSAAQSSPPASARWSPGSAAERSRSSVSVLR